MKVALVSMNAGPLACLGGVEGGGQSVVIDGLSRELAAGGHTVTVYAQRDDPSLPGCLTTTSGVHIDHVGAALPADRVAPLLLEAIEAFRARLVEEWSIVAPDVVHAHSWMSGKAAVGAAAAFGIPVVQTFHGMSRAKRGRGAPADADGLRSLEEAALVRAAARVVATSSAEVFALLGMGASPGAVKLIPCGVDLERFRPASRPSHVGRPFRLATLSRLVADAGVADVIDALRFLGEEVELHVGGGGSGPAELEHDPDARQLRELAARLGVASRVTFHGHIRRDDVAAFLQAADAVVCAPWYDSIGTVALEAMACGIPVVVSAVGSHVDAVADGIGGLHVPPRAPRHIADAVERLAASPSLCERFRRLGIERATVRYGWPRITAETLDVYRAVATEPAQLSRSCS